MELTDRYRLRENVASYTRPTQGLRTRFSGTATPLHRKLAVSRQRAVDTNHAARRFQRGRPKRQGRRQGGLQPLAKAEAYTRFRRRRAGDQAGLADRRQAQQLLRFAQVRK